jgi:hypothetical protein
MIVTDTYRGDDITINGRINQNITGWKIKCEIWDRESNSIKKATSNVTGGGDEQVLITNADEGRFNVYVVAGETSNFIGDAQVEIVAIDTNDSETTVFNEYFSLKDRQIDWDTIT